eukprot:scaffold28403_cov112-Isochrysis_galbana.AAC.5
MLTSHDACQVDWLVNLPSCLLAIALAACSAGYRSRSFAAPRAGTHPFQLEHAACMLDGMA